MFHYALTVFFGNGPAALIASQAFDLVLGGLLLAYVVYVAMTTRSSLDKEQVFLPVKPVAATASERRRPQFEGLLKARSITECSTLVLAADRGLPEFEKLVQRARIVDDRNTCASASLRPLPVVRSATSVSPLSVAIPAPLFPARSKAPLVIDWVPKPQLVLSTVDDQQLPLAPVEPMEFEWNPVAVVCAPPVQAKSSAFRPAPVCSPVLIHAEAPTDMEWEQTFAVPMVNQPDNSSGSTKTDDSASTADMASAPAAPAATIVSNPVAPGPSAAPPSSTTFNFAGPTISLGPAMPGTGAVFSNTSMVTNSALINAPATRRKTNPAPRRR